jgi:hypothetical protein
MRSMTPTKAAILFQLELLRCFSLIFGSVIISLFTLCTTEDNDVSHDISYIWFRQFIFELSYKCIKRRYKYPSLNVRLT